MSESRVERDSPERWQWEPDTDSIHTQECAYVHFHSCVDRGGFPSGWSVQAENRTLRPAKVELS